MKKVNIYSTPTCGYCKMAKEFFTENNVEFNDYNVATDEEKRNELIELTEQMGVPVITITEEGGEPEIIKGFDRPRVSELLGLQK
ncbi:MAG: NrdH-redoxin [Candidatus Pacebacteria bacterium]|nr:NrdH-redoxin [Candidatus Paceibacterota bacterium]